MSNALVPIRQTLPVPVTVEEIQTFALNMAKSALFADTREAAQCFVKIVAGAEMGIPPFQAMSGIYIIKGRLSLSANLMAQIIKGHPKYNYKVTTHTKELCQIEFFENGESIGVSEFSLADAKAAGTQNLDKFARNMLFARAMSNGARWYCPDAFSGTPYVPEELGVKVDGEGEPIEAQFVPTAQPTPQPLRIEAADAEPDPRLETLRRIREGMKKNSIKLNPDAIARVLYIAKENAEDCFNKEGQLLWKEMSEEELDRILYFIENQGAILDKDYKFEKI